MNLHKRKKRKTVKMINMPERVKRRLRIKFRKKLFSWKISMERSALQTNNLKQVIRKSIQPIKRQLYISILTSWVKNSQRRTKKCGWKFRRLMIHSLTQVDVRSMTPAYLLMMWFLRKVTLPMQISTKHMLKFSKIMLGSQQLSLSQILVMKTRQWRRCENSTNFGITSKPGENSLSMMNMTKMMQKIGMRNGGWKNKIKN